MTDPASFDSEVLEWVMDDYEAPHTIAADMARELKRPISEAEVLEALRRLAHMGRVQAFLIDKGRQGFRPVSPEVAQRADDVWFMAMETTKRYGR